MHVCSLTLYHNEGIFKLEVKQPVTNTSTRHVRVNFNTSLSLNNESFQLTKLRVSKSCKKHSKCSSLDYCGSLPFLNGFKVSERQIQYKWKFRLFHLTVSGQIILYYYYYYILLLLLLLYYTTKMYEIYCIERGANIYIIVVLVPK